jgi:hypothetical protein
VSESLRFGVLGGLAALIVVGMLTARSDRGAGSHGGAAPEPVVVLSNPDNPLPKKAGKTCSIDRSGLRMDARPDPGLSQPTELPVIPTYRTYMPARVQALVCPASEDCALPDQVPAALWVSTDRERYDRAPLEAQVVSRGRCVELRWDGKTAELWPDAEAGVVQWAVVVGTPSEPFEPRAWRVGGGVVWTGDVVHAGESGSPEVY